MQQKILIVTVTENADEEKKRTPISAGYIIAMLRQEGWNAESIELNSEKQTAKQAAEILLKEKPTIIGFSTYNNNIEAILDIATHIKKSKKTILTILGGPQIIFMPALALKNMPSIDMLIHGNGEQTTTQVLKELFIEHKKIQDIQTPGITARSNNKIIQTTPFQPEQINLDILPSPYLNNIFDLEKYTQAIVLTSRGCKHNCIFCHTPKAFKGISYHSIQRVIDELKIISKSNIKEVFFADPNFISDKKRTKELLERIIKEKINISFWCESRFDELNEELIKLLKKAGAKEIAFGLETINEKTSKQINKRINRKEIEKTITLCKKENITVEMMFICGLPNETFEDIRQTIQFIEQQGISLRKNSAGQELKIYFGTEIYNRPEKYGYSFVKKEDAYKAPGKNYQNNALTSEKRKILNTYLQMKRKKYEKTLF